MELRPELIPRPVDKKLIKDLKKRIRKISDLFFRLFTDLCGFLR